MENMDSLNIPGTMKSEALLKWLEGQQQQWWHKFMQHILENEKASIQVGVYSYFQRWEGRVLMKMGPVDDPEAFLETFEQVT